ncbi:hypothetical protein QVD17_38005 [Tagetes erecta]|uniref:Uncharacterized protein n=1 Tax=Tagetes erecta TaxID=13708 RepID=A0AAD8JXU8_TARER|nr:hypothetical protein QVD17_38005 [Tagetes erecta]
MHSSPSSVPNPSSSLGPVKIKDVTNKKPSAVFQGSKPSQRPLRNLKKEFKHNVSAKDLIGSSQPKDVIQSYQQNVVSVTDANVTPASNTEKSTVTSPLVCSKNSLVSSTSSHLKRNLSDAYDVDPPTANSTTKLPRGSVSSGQVDDIRLLVPKLEKCHFRLATVLIIFTTTIGCLMLFARLRFGFFCCDWGIRGLLAIIRVWNLGSYEVWIALFVDRQSICGVCGYYYAVNGCYLVSSVNLPVNSCSSHDSDDPEYFDSSVLKYRLLLSVCIIAFLLTICVVDSMPELLDLVHLEAASKHSE